MADLISMKRRWWHICRSNRCNPALFAVLLSAVAGVCQAHELHDQTGQQLRVGVYENFPIASLAADGGMSGIGIDVLDHIAGEQQWRIEYLPGNWKQQLQRLQQHEIDLLVGVPHGIQGGPVMDYNQLPLISDWGMVYRRPDDELSSVLDMAGRRIAVITDSPHSAAFMELVRRFEVAIEPHPVESSADAMAAVIRGEADMAVVSRLFGALSAERFGLVESGIVFNPTNIHYAAPKGGHQELLTAIDKHLERLKNQQNSIYFQSLRQWFAQPRADVFPNWLLWLLVVLAGVLLSVAGIAVLLKQQVAARTQELASEIQERRKAQSKLRQLAHFDPLTNLPNRRSFNDALRNAIAEVKRNGQKMAVLFVDLDRFKTVNDSLGHDAGDELITKVAQRLSYCIRDGDAVYRFGGDEFVVLLSSLDKVEAVQLVADRMLRSLSTPIHIQASELYVSASIGIMLCPDDDDTVEGLLKGADAAMYHAKEQGGNRYHLYNAQLTAKVQERFNMESRLRQALRREEMRLLYQPVVDLRTAQVLGVEALLRWDDPQRGLLSPDAFISLAEETGLIVPIGDWVLEQACLQLAEWDKGGLGRLRLAVNVSSVQFEHGSLGDSVRRALAASGLSPERLELEITESLFIEHQSVGQAQIEKVREQGVCFAIDDFGTGYSSLSYLKKLPIDSLKIDRSFVRDIPHDRDDTQIASTIIGMAQGLGLAVVAEGIETQAQWDFLRQRGCQFGQGYFFSRPLTAAEFVSWLSERAARTG